jgi:hypothetical protein
MPRRWMGLMVLLLPVFAWADTATLTWNHDGQNTTAYQIQRKPASGAYATIGQTPTGTLTYVDQNVAAGDYCWHVAALNQAVVGPYSPESCATATGGASSPTAPYNITIVITPGARTCVSGPRHDGARRVNHEGTMKAHKGRTKEARALTDTELVAAIARCARQLKELKQLWAARKRARKGNDGGSPGGRRGPPGVVA